MRRVAQFGATIATLLLQTAVAAEPLTPPVTGDISVPGRSMTLNDDGTGTALQDGTATRLAIDGGSVILFFDAVFAFDVKGNLLREFSHDGIQMGDLLHRMAGVEAFTVRQDLDTRRAVAAELEALDIPRSAAELNKRIAQDRPAIMATGDEVANQSAIDRLGADLARGDIRLLESSRARLIGFGPPLSGARPDIMIAAEPDEPLFLSPAHGAAATNTLGSRLIFAAPSLAPETWRRGICIPLRGCGWSEINALTEVRADWLQIDKETGRLEAVVLH
ncbi:hypothetical protein [Lentibacter sp. XHP0401]|uniref:hypothetical protein n=1 Tax=Lentibacter sp. XHP0401 TaxID=2984334 RepID=UPI0021E8C527|nr:hypothetical protein [Lentibacter sp. XHP0401]MCV2894631.1 hypothetical protein [Lentibacter sp. XHP0401]